MTKEKIKNYNLLKNQALLLGANLFGVADILEEKENFNLPGKSIETLNSAVVIAVTLSSGIFKTLEEAPNKIYFHHYRSANMFLDQLSFRLSNFIESKGFCALPIPASQIVDWEKQRAHLSHKRIGYLAGLGWIGRNNLLVNKNLGARFRLTTILTDMPLKRDLPDKISCGSCFACIKACPVEAIKQDKKDFDHQRCFEKLKEFQKQGVVSQYICGVCVKACNGS
jgi:epoxyqueuosine reductase QueG